MSEQVMISRELLERIAELLSWKGGISRHTDDVHAAYFELGAALSVSAQPAGVDGLEVVGVRVTSDGFGSYIADSAMGIPAAFPGEVREPLCRLSSASSIIIGLQKKIERLKFSLEVAKTDELSAAVYAETESIKHSLWDSEKERDQHAKRIGELEGLLYEASGELRTDRHHGLGPRIDAALSAGKEVE